MSDKEKLARFETLVREMLRADDEYGCGFYNQAAWLVPYNQLRELVDMPDPNA